MMNQSKDKQIEKKVMTNDRLIRNIENDDWDAFNALKAEHNKKYPDRKVSNRLFFKLINTYSPFVKSLMTLDPNDTPIQQIGVNTALLLAPQWCKNIANNLSRIHCEKDIRDLYGVHAGKSAIVVGAGDSLFDNASKTNHLEVLAKYVKSFDGIILVTDHYIDKFIEYGIGDYVCIIDGSELIYTRFMDNKTVKNKRPDQKPNIGIFANCAHEKVINCWKDSIYFFTPSIPAEILPNATSLMEDFSGNTSINGGGHAGALAWNLAAWMGCKEIALVGIDLSYKITTPLKQLQSYNMYLNALGKEHVKEGYFEGINPFFGIQYRTDSIYDAFKEAMINWILAFQERGTCKTINCTEGGSIYHRDIESMYLEDFLESHIKK